MPANVRTMAFRGETPWHGLGNTIAPEMTVEEIAEIAGLDYTIESIPVGARIGELLPINKRAFLTLDGFKLIWSPELGTQFQIATDRYQPVQPKQVCEFFKEFCERGELEIETAGVLKDGAINWCLAKTKHSFMLKGQDENKSYVMIVTSHDGSIRTCVMPTSVRVVCQNTLQLAFAAKSKSDKMFMLKHSTKFDTEKMTEAKKAVGLTVETMKKFAESANKLAEFKTDKIIRENMVFALTQPTLLHEIAEKTMQLSADAQFNGNVLMNVLENYEINRRIHEVDQNRVGKAVLAAIANSPGSNLPSAQDTLWGVLNGVTYYVDHTAGTEDRDKALTSAWFGSRANLKDSVLDMCLEMVSVTK